MTDYHEYHPDRYRQIPGSEYGARNGGSGVGVLVALAAIALFFGALLMFAGTPADDSEQTAARQPAPVERPVTEPVN
jgi:hypothetical protein